jgi:hypothetical protein
MLEACPPMASPVSGTVHPKPETLPEVYDGATLLEWKQETALRGARRLPICKVNAGARRECLEAWLRVVECRPWGGRLKFAGG